jgi:hypothetical protein
MSDLFDDTKLNIIKLLYRMIAFPEKELTEEDKKLLERL